MRGFVSVLALLLAIPILYAENVEITSNSFEADETRRVSIFTGDVHVKKGKDRIDSQKLIVYFDKERKPIKYEALKDVTFKIVMDSNKSYEGKAQKIVYFPKEAKYLLEKDVFILQKPENRKIYGEKVIVNRQNGQARVEGGKKPVKFIFNVEENATGEGN